MDGFKNTANICGNVFGGKNYPYNYDGLPV